MSGVNRIDCGMPALVEFRGPDAVRFLNGQLTQDVRLVAGGKKSLPSCVTDAKGRLQFRVWITESDEGALWVEGAAGLAEELEARLTRYLIADDVVVSPLSEKWKLVHFTGTPPEASAGVMVRESARFNVPGTDWWIPSGTEVMFPLACPLIEGDALEELRISNGVPAWGRELTAGLLPPEAGLDASDISYHKGCYIGQEVISRIKFAGRLNKRLVRLALGEEILREWVELVDADGKPAGNLTSVSPEAAAGIRHAMAYVKRGVASVFVVDGDGNRHAVAIL